ncbi:hypothetical protein EDB92DRAFT_1797232, partial [Lactarius akahatsu]
GTRFADDLEGQNDEAIEGLGAKLKFLKEITIGIGNEVRESTVQLSQMNDAFAETSGILAGTFRRMNSRMNNMADRQGCRWLWYIIFLIFVFCFFLSSCGVVVPAVARPLRIVSPGFSCYLFVFRCNRLRANQQCWCYMTFISMFCSCTSCQCARDSAR